MSNALGGGPLEGNNVVRLVYCDEAGISNPAQEPFAVVAALVVHGDQILNALERRLEGLVERHIPKQHQSDTTFVMNSWGNSFGVFTPEQVASMPVQTF